MAKPFGSDFGSGPGSGSGQWQGHVLWYLQQGGHRNHGSSLPLSLFSVCLLRARVRSESVSVHWEPEKGVLCIPDNQITQWEVESPTQTHEKLSVDAFIPTHTFTHTC